ncbi:MAG: NUDIX hydrolase [Bacteroidales bacterium]|nr:NUDIX hydrolase [Bacteroidales bacterium]
MTKVYSEHPKHYVAVDCIIFGYEIADRELKLLLIKRGFDPAKGKWSLAGGFVQEGESLDDAASRVLRSLTGISDLYMEQLYSYGDVERDPGARVISSAYFALIGIHEIDRMKQAKNGAHWRSIADLPDLIFDHRKMVDRALAELVESIRVHPVGFELHISTSEPLRLSTLHIDNRKEGHPS